MHLGPFLSMVSIFFKTAALITASFWPFSVSAQLTFSPVPSPAATAAPTSTPYFSVTFGSCFLSSSAACINSPYYPANYGNSESCSIAVLRDATLSAVTFDTESSYDALRIGGVAYSGSTGPSQFDVSAGSVITFVSDSIVVYSGFQICVESASTSSAGAIMGNATATAKTTASTSALAQNIIVFFSIIIILCCLQRLIVGLFAPKREELVSGPCDDAANSGLQMTRTAAATTTSQMAVVPASKVSVLLNQQSHGGGGGDGGGGAFIVTDVQVVSPKRGSA